MEMVMVLVVIGLLLSIVVPKFTAQMGEAKSVQTQANLSSLRSAVEIYKRQSGTYPTDLIDMETAVAGYSDPVVRLVPTMDAWGNLWYYDNVLGQIFIDCDVVGSPTGIPTGSGDYPTGACAW